MQSRHASKAKRVDNRALETTMQVYALEIIMQPFSRVDRCQLSSKLSVNTPPEREFFRWMVSECCTPWQSKDTKKNGSSTRSLLLSSPCIHLTDNGNSYFRRWSEHSRVEKWLTRLTAELRNTHASRNYRWLKFSFVAWFLNLSYSYVP